MPGSGAQGRWVREKIAGDEEQGEGELEAFFHHVFGFLTFSFSI